jgi:hypothetical protein
MSRFTLLDEYVPTEEQRAAVVGVISEQPVRRGPGRPRKQSVNAMQTGLASATNAKLPPVNGGIVVIVRRGAADLMCRSISAIKRLEKSDPDWPKPFAIGGQARSNYLLRDIEAYLVKKAADASAANIVT